MLYDKNRFLVIAGPCMAESKEVVQSVAHVLAELQKQLPEIQVIFKASFDKANRAKLTSQRGIGQERGLELLAWVKSNYGLPIVTDVHEPSQCAEVAQVCDVLQIPAFLCRQTDLLVAAAQTQKTIQVKKGQFLSPYEMEFVVDKLKRSGANEVWQVERGTTFGYQNLIVDYRSFSIMSQWGRPVIFDSHCVQRPGTVDGQSGGEAQYIESLAQAACAGGADGIFIETHPCPSKAQSDAATQISLDKFPVLVSRCVQIWKLVQSFQ